MSPSHSTPSVEATTPPKTIAAQLFKAFWKGAIIPVSLLVFFIVAPRWLNSRLHTAIAEGVTNTTRLSDIDKARRLESLARVNFADVSVSTDPGLQGLRRSFEEAGIAGQFRRLRWGRELSMALLVIVLGVNGVTLLLNRKARQSREALISAYRTGWSLAIFGALTDVFLMIPLLAYGIFEFTTLAADRYFPQLIAAIVIGGLIALWRSANILLKAPPLEFEEKMAREIRPDEAPALWDAVRHAAAQLKTAPPDHIVVGMQMNFYVTELAVKHSGGRTIGRTLFLSQPLLKQLTSDEVMAIIGHELGHFMGEDTKLTREFYPLRHKANATLFALAHSGWVGWTSVHSLSFFHWCFGGTEQAMSRQRELAADQVGATLTSPETAARALVRLHVVSQAYQLALTGEGGRRIDDLMEESLTPYIREHLAPRTAFWTELFATKTPHPLDSHPLLQERLAALEQPMSPEDAIAIATVDATSAYAAWFEGKEALFAEVNKEARAEIARIRTQIDVGQADPTTAPGRELLERTFPERRWKVRPFPVWLMILFCGGIGAAVGVVGALVADGAITSILIGIAVLLFALGWIGCRRYWRAELILRAEGLQCSGWDRPLDFSDVAAVSAVRNNGGITVTFRLKRPMRPLWEGSLPYRRKAETLTLSWWSEKQDETWQTIFRYYTRQMEPVE